MLLRHYPDALAVETEGEDKQNSLKLYFVWIRLDTGTAEQGGSLGFYKYMQLYLAVVSDFVFVLAVFRSHNNVRILKTDFLSICSV